VILKHAVKNLYEWYDRHSCFFNISMPSFFKSTGSIVVGFLIVVVLSVGTDAVVEKLGILPPASQPEAYTTWMLAFALFYRTVYTVLAGYITAHLAPSKPFRHATILGIIGTIAGTAGAIAGWDLSAHWYPIALAVLALPSTYLGGKIHEMR
jgi:hypothetical protein